MKEKYLYDIIKNPKTGLPELRQTLELEVVIGSDHCYDEDDCMTLMQLNFALDILDNEHLYIVGFDHYDRLCGVYCVSSGDFKSVQHYNRNIALFLLLVGARKFRMFHNHPDNALSGSSGDYQVMGFMISLGNVIGIEFIDSYVLCPDGWIKLAGGERVNEYMIER